MEKSRLGIGDGECQDGGRATNVNKVFSIGLTSCDICSKHIVQFLSSASIIWGEGRALGKSIRQVTKRSESSSSPS